MLWYLISVLFFLCVYFFFVILASVISIFFLFILFVVFFFFFFFFQAEDGIRDGRVTGVQTCALPILLISKLVGFDIFGQTVPLIIKSDLAADAPYVVGIPADQGFMVHTQSKGKRSEEHTSELQSPVHLVCRLLLEKKNNGFPHDQLRL